ncbi:hypothetical protein PENSUB_1923 [Penicillium subrubescens]|uniref:Uncharacterized protein n=1 Tax=Penicillium subrubescens TaxID=1316194 RepID=A0A1Q5UIX1_9EURO|nr:hypothetical protein PENSUB_1923 [Penicillium subrubescens]
MSPSQMTDDIGVHKEHRESDTKVVRLTKDLAQLQRQRMVKELQVQIAEERLKLDEAQRYLDLVQQKIGLDRSDSISPQSPAVVTSSGQDLNSAVDALIESFSNPACKNERSVMNDTPTDGHASAYCKQETLTEHARIINGGVKRESPVPVVWSNGPESGSTLSKGPFNEENYYTETRKVQLGGKYIGRSLKNRWDDFIKTPGNTTWNSYCTFLAQQLSRRATPQQARYGITTARQKLAQPVTHFSLWLIQWAPVLPQVSTQSFMDYLLQGILPSIRDRIEMSSTQFSDYTSFTAYLQEVENIIPARAKIVRRRKQSAFSNDEHLVCTGTDGLKSSPKDDIMTQSTRRTRALPPKELNGQFKRRLSSDEPPQGLSVYSSRGWWEFKMFMSQLQHHLDKHGERFSKPQKIKIAMTNLSAALLEKWNEHAARLKTVTWFAFCVFLVNQLPVERSGRTRYYTMYQWCDQSVSTFALELLRWAPDNLSPNQDHMQHLWNRVHLEIRSEARRTWRDFADFHVFVAYLQQVQDSFSSPQQAEGHDSPQPRKRLRVSEDR